MKRILFTLLSTFVICSLSAKTFNVKNYGAKGNGKTIDTKAIQSAIDDASKAGGGLVELDAGTYISGSIFLKDNVELHLNHGATIKGSDNILDYKSGGTRYQNSFKGDNTTGGHLIMGIGVKNVTISGPGKIDGNSPKFLTDENGNGFPSKKDIINRPAQMIWIVNSTDIRIKDVELANSPYWTCFILNCERIWITGCYIHTENKKYHTYNGDGIDIDRSMYVQISDCRIDTEDDCITLRASCESILDDLKDCAFVTVSNCNISSSCNAIRLGVGEGNIHDAVISGLTISNSKTPINIVGAYGKNGRGTNITDIRISNIQLKDCQDFMRIHHMYSTKAIFRNILIDGISGNVKKGIYVRASRVTPFENIVFRNIDVDCEYEVTNADVIVQGGLIKKKHLSQEEKKKIEDDIDNFRNLLY